MVAAADTQGRGDDKRMNELTPEELRGVFVAVVRASTCVALKLRPREVKLVHLLAVESLAQGSASGEINFALWERHLRPTWRTNELKDEIQRMARLGWLALEPGAGRYRLCPDRLPGWGDVQTLLGQVHSPESSVLSLETEADLRKAWAATSQENAARQIPKYPNTQIPNPGSAERGVRSAEFGTGNVTKFSQGFTKFSQPVAAPNISNRVLEINSTVPRVLEGRGFWDDRYVTDKLGRARALRQELQENRTPMARRFVILYTQKPDRARELVGMATDGQQRNPASWLNTVLINEGVTY